MVVDSSALIAILLGEPDAGDLSDAIAAADLCLLSAANLLETAIVLDNQVDPRVGRQLDSYIEHAGIRIEPVTEAQVRIARQAYADFGRGNHPAKLNFGDCFAYALSKATGEPLLFKGDDFGHTNVRAAAVPER
jgi:ribonuclease VapC